MSGTYVVEIRTKRALPLRLRYFTSQETAMFGPTSGEARFSGFNFIFVLYNVHEVCFCNLTFI